MRASLLALLVSTTLAAGCTPRREDGRFACEISDPGSCPSGFYCQVRGDQPEPRCYATAVTGVCGDGQVDPGEACDGDDTVATTCHALGYWYGTPRCSAGCQVDASGCVPLASVSLGPDVACGLDGRGLAWCWGTGTFGLLGTDPGRSGLHVEPEPASVAEPLVQVQVGFYHACGLSEGGAAWCWGLNQWGALGPDVALDDYSAPIALTTPVTFVQLAVGYIHTCGLDDTGTIWCWGGNYFGQLGDGTRADRAQPAPVQSSRRFTEVVAGTSLTCALDEEHQAWCWGVNAWGKLGDGVEHHEDCDPIDCSPWPVAVASGTPLVTLSAASWSHTCGLDGDDRAWCWGGNSEGQLGDGTTEDRAVPTRVAGDHRFASLSVGFERTSGVDREGVAWSWGKGAPGDGSAGGASSPVAAVTDDRFMGITSGWGATCGLIAPGHLSCWGFGGSGNLGESSAGRLPGAMTVAGPPQDLTTGAFHSCGLNAEGRAWCWGINLYGQLGSSGWQDFAARPVAGEQTFAALAAGNYLTAGLDADGRLLTWGYVPTSESSALANLEPTLAPGSGEYVAVAAGELHLCVLDASGLASCWGDNAWGQLGTGGAWATEGPLPVAGDHVFSRLAPGSFSTCGLDLDGAAWCWGENSFGTLGDGSDHDRATPVRVQGDHRFVDLACGGLHCCGIDDVGEGWCWGDNRVGALGTGGLDYAYTEPARVRSTTGLVRIAAGLDHTCALDVDGAAWCWGGSGDLGGEVLGAGLDVAMFVPVPVDAAERFVDLRAGAFRTCGQVVQGGWYCWGRNASGELGIDDQVRFPRRVPGPVAP